MKVLDVVGKIKEVMMPSLQEFKGNWLTDKYVAGMFSQNHTQVLKMLTQDIGYADLTSWWNQSTKDSLISMEKKSKGFIIDIRGYPHEVDDIVFKLFDSLTRKIKPEITETIAGGLPATSPVVVRVERWGIPLTTDKNNTLSIWNDRKINVPVKIFSANQRFCPKLG